MTIPANALPHRVQIQQPHFEPDDGGGPLPTWETIQTVWASIEPLRGRDQGIFAGERSSIDTRIRLRWAPRLAGMDSSWRLLHTVLGRQTVYDLQSVVDIEGRHAWLELLATSGVTDG